MTRSTLLRVVLAISCYAKGDASTGRLWLPRKWKIRYLDPEMLRRMRLISGAMLAVLHNNYVGTRLMGKWSGCFQGEGSKIGDTVVVRKPKVFGGKDG